MPLTFNLEDFEYEVNSKDKELSIIPKKANKIPVTCSGTYGVPGVIGPIFEIDIFDLIHSTVERQTYLARNDLL